jgi:signal transduction histidine kinase
MLQRAAGVGWGAVVASALVLTLTSAATAWAARRLISMIGLVVSSEVARRVAEEQSEEILRAKTALERVNAKLQGAYAELQEAQRDSETLSNLLVHDMKGPLTAVLGTFDLVEMRLEDVGEIEETVPGLLDDFATGRRAASRLLGMIGDLLGIARLEHGGIRASRSATDVAEMVSEVSGDHARSASVRGIRLLTRAPVSLPASIDAELVRRALDNLVSNAISFAGRDQRVEVEALREDGALVLRVRNDGPVIPTEARSNLFAKHSMMGARRGHHAGLGLYLCRLVADSHGGGITLMDEPGWSVSFAMRLPDSCALETKPAA